MKKTGTHNQSRRPLPFLRQIIQLNNCQFSYFTLLRTAYPKPPRLTFIFLTLIAVNCPLFVLEQVLVPSQFSNQLYIQPIGRGNGRILRCKYPRGHRDSLVYALLRTLGQQLAEAGEY